MGTELAPVMSPGVRKLALSAHVVVSVGWLGAVAAFLALAIAGVVVTDGVRAAGFGVSMALIAWWVIVPSSVASLVTGIVQSLGTHWGLVRHHWVIIKLLMNALGSALLLVHMGPIDRVARAAQESTAAGGDLHHVKVRLIGDAVAAIVMLLVASALSVYKPRGRTRVGEDATLPDDGTHEDDRR
jgi:hypothetical protein